MCVRLTEERLVKDRIPPQKGKWKREEGWDSSLENAFRDERNWLTDIRQLPPIHSVNINASSRADKEYNEYFLDHNFGDCSIVTESSIINPSKTTAQNIREKTPS